MDEDFKRQLLETIGETPRVPGVFWPMALSVAMLRALEKRQPGFRDAVREEIRRSAEAMASSDDPEDREDAPSMQELADSWVFTE